MSNRTEVVFTAAHDREVRISADPQTIIRRAMAWSGTYTPGRLMRWIGFYERLAAGPETARAKAKADAEVLHAARDLLKQEGVLT